MNQQFIEQSGTGSVERTGTGFIEQTGTGHVEQTGTGSIERSGTGAIERTGTGRVTRLLMGVAAFAACFSTFATEMYATDLGGLSIARHGGKVNVSWHYTDGEKNLLIVGQGQLAKNFGNFDLHQVNFQAVDKVINDGTSNDKVANDGTSSDKVANDGTSSDKVVNDGTSNAFAGHSIVVDDSGYDNDVALNDEYVNVVNDGTSNDKSLSRWGKMELIFTEWGVEVVAVRQSEKGEWETIVLDLQDGTDFSQSIVFVDAD